MIDKIVSSDELLKLMDELEQTINTEDNIRYLGNWGPYMTIWNQLKGWIQGKQHKES